MILFYFVYLYVKRQLLNTVMKYKQDKPLHSQIYTHNYANDKKKKTFQMRKIKY